MELKKEILYRFFNGTIDEEEGKEVRKYLEDSKDNWEEFLHERKLFDALIVNGGIEVQKKLQKRRAIFHRYIKEAIKIAAVFIVAIGLSFLWLRDSETKDTKTIINTLSGQMANVTLPDGTQVWLNSNTRLEFPTVFAKNEREIKIDGEAYFEVAHNVRKPFLVHTPRKETVEVLGTKFYVNAYSNTGNFETALMEGSVKVNTDNNSFIISPLQRAVLRDGNMVIERITSLDVYRWREGLICFKNEHFMDIIKGLEKYYGVKISISDTNIKNPQLTVKFRLSDGIEYALRILQKEINFSYTRDDEENIFVIQK